MNAATVAFLRNVRALLTDPDHWTRDVYAADAKGVTCAPTDAEAARWCLLGAIDRIEDEAMGAVPSGEAAAAGDDASHLLADLVGTQELSHWNDTHRHREVLALLDAAIAKGEAEVAP